MNGDKQAWSVTLFLFLFLYCFNKEESFMAYGVSPKVKAENKSILIKGYQVAFPVTRLVQALLVTFLPQL